MESPDALKELLVAKIQGKFVTDHGVHYARLRERSPGAKMKKVDIHGVPVKISHQRIVDKSWLF